MSSLWPAITVLLLFAFGGAVGAWLRFSPKLLVVVGRATAWLVYLLLLLLGHSVGSNQTVVGQIGTIGIQALVLSFGAVTGSLLAVALYSRYVLASLRAKHNASGLPENGLVKSMMGSAVLMLFFMGGLGLGFFNIDNGAVAQASFTEYTLYTLMWMVGVSVGGDRDAWATLKKGKLSLLGVPMTIAVGSLAGAWGCSLCLPDVMLHEGMAVGAGMGYYSLSSVFISELSGERLATIALLANIFREIFTLVATPLLCRLFGPLAGVASAGATAMDTSLPVIMRVSGPEIGTVAVLSGFVLTAFVPLLVPLMFVWQ